MASLWGRKVLIPAQTLTHGRASLSTLLHLYVPGGPCVHLPHWAVVITKSDIAWYPPGTEPVGRSVRFLH